MCMSEQARPSGDKLNVGSGQRPFSREHGWINIDSNPRWNPDVVADWNSLTMFEDNSMDLVVSHHSLEHVGCGEGKPFIGEAYRVLRPGGSLLIFVPDMRILVYRWITNQMTTQLYMTNVYGAYMGDEADRHKWGYDHVSLVEFIRSCDVPWSKIMAFDDRPIAGADIAKDYWILGMEAVK